MITGGAGFVGINLADKLLDEGQPVRILDDLSRHGVEHNLEWLRSRHRRGLQYIKGDVRDAAVVQAAINGSTFVYHLAAQVAVTTSLDDPLTDHAINTIGTLNVLEGIRKASDPPGLMFASTNKVYGALPDLALVQVGNRCVPRADEIREHGIAEDRPLDFISPYGCSKGAADQYVLDYCHSFGLTAVVLRMSCIYGQHQQATSDQGWVAHFLRTALAGEELTIFGDGMQVRDVLYADDFVAALLAVREQAERLSGWAYNIGGGPANTLSLLEMIETAERLNDRPVNVRFAERRPGDQLYFAADHRRFTEVTGWRPVTSPEEGIDHVWTWLLTEDAAHRRPALQSGERRA